MHFTLKISTLKYILVLYTIINEKKTVHVEQPQLLKNSYIGQEDDLFFFM